MQLDGIKAHQLLGAWVLNNITALPVQHLLQAGTADARILPDNLISVVATSSNMQGDILVQGWDTCEESASRPLEDCCSPTTSQET